MSIQKIKKEDIDFSKIYGNSANAKEHGSNTVKVNEMYWGDNGDLYFDEETGMISENGVGLGFANIEDIKKTSSNSNYNGSYRDNSDIMKQNSNTSYLEDEEAVSETAPIESINSTEESSSKNEVEEEVKTEETIEQPEPEKISDVDISELVPDESVQKTDESSVQTSGEYKPEDFNFKHEDSNILAAKAKNMGFTDEQVKIAIGISRHETGNYKHLAYGYNYGGVTGKGDLGSQGGYAKYSSKDVGMDAYLTNLKKNYFDQGLNSVETMARKYLGYDATSNWIKAVHSSMN